MSGERFLLDTNAMIALLQGDQTLVEWLADANWVGVSIISQLESKAFPNLSEADETAIDQFLHRVDVVGVTAAQHSLLKLILSVRRERNIKLPDAIIVATAMDNGAILVTSDKDLLKLTGVPLRDYSKV
jgi:hypothetical protein